MKNAAEKGRKRGDGLGDVKSHYEALTSIILRISTNAFYDLNPSIHGVSEFKNKKAHPLSNELF
ncbi:MAG: hypothetical protein IPL46_08190 [Saprospiraceae bacterium]|nr:hypothetical protein [Saprospiraceae bacterium]